jgi:MFS family permease
MSITTERAKSVRISLTIGFVLQGALGTVMIPRIPELIDQIGVNFTAWGAIIGFSGLGSLIGLMFANRFIVRFGSRLVYQASAVTTAALIVILPYLANPWLFFLLQVAMAFVGSCFNVALNAQAVLLQKLLNRTIVPKLHAAWSIGAATSAALSAFMAGFLPMWLHFLIVPALAAVVLGMAATRALTSDEIGAVSGRNTFKKTPFWKSPGQLWLISAGWFAGVFPEAAIIDWSSVFGRKSLMLDAALSAVPYTFFVVAMIVSRLSIARLTRTRHVGVISFWGGIFGAVAMGIGAIFGPMIGVDNKIFGLIFTAAFWFAAGLGIGPMSPSFTAASGHIKGLSTAQGLARVSLVTSVLMMGAKVMMGAIAQNVNLTVAFILPTISLFVAGVISGMIAKSENQVKTVVTDAFPITGSIAIHPADE